MDHLPDLVASICTDSQLAKNIKCGRTKTTQLAQFIAPQNIADISHEVKSKNLCYSIIVDESTDLSAMKSLAVVIRYFCGKGIRDRFLDLVEVNDQTANGLHTALMECLKKNDIPLELMIGFPADNASLLPQYQR